MKRVFLVLFNLCVDLFLSLRDRIVEKHKIKQARIFQREVFRSVRHAQSIGIDEEWSHFVSEFTTDPDWYMNYHKFVQSCHLNTIGPYQDKKEKGDMK